MNQDLYVYFDLDDTSKCDNHEHGNQKLQVYIGNSPQIFYKFIPKNWCINYTTQYDDTGCRNCGKKLSYYNFQIVNPQITKSYKITYNQLIDTTLSKEP